MKQRSISALGVGLVGLVPAIMGGPVWAIAFMVLCLVGYAEFHRMAVRLSSGTRPFGYLLVPLFAVVPFVDQPERWLTGLVFLAIVLPLAEATLRSDLQGSVTDWALSAAGTLYLGIPLYGAIELRRMPGDVSRNWLEDLADTAAIDWPSLPRGLAWLLTVLLCTWMADAFAYIVGKQIGKHKLSPVVSPNKSVEGLAGGVIAAALTGALGVWAFGLTDRIWIGLLFGVAIAIIGLFGDLSESVLKRQAGIKDSGSFIPGHGGMLDRLDALLFTFVAGWYLALLADSIIL